MGDPRPAELYTLEDHLGSASATVDATGTVMSREEYYPFGETSFGSHEKQRYRFCGKERDAKSGFYYFGARYYTAWLCRFVSVDPLASQMANIASHTYTKNNPLNFNDPDGKKPSPHEAARMANFVYGGSDAGTLPDGWVPSSFKPEGLVFENEKTGFRSALYEHTNADGKIEYAYVSQGTDVTSGKDWVTDLLQGLGIQTKQYKQSVTNARILAAKLKGSEITFIGHSLGGGLASANALATGKNAITFNAAGLSEKTRRREGLPSKAALGQIDAYVVESEIVSRVQSVKSLIAEGAVTMLPLQLRLTGKIEPDNKASNSADAAKLVMLSREARPYFWG